MIKTSAKTTSILAVAIAAIMVLCAVSGAIVYNSNSNNNTTDSGDIPVSPIRPIDDPEKVTTLPSSSSDLMTMLSKSGENGNALLVDRLANNNYTFNGATYSIKTNNDVAKYLYSLGYTVIGDYLVAELSSDDAIIKDMTVDTVDSLVRTVPELIDETKEDISNNYALNPYKEDSSSDVISEVVFTKAEKDSSSDVISEVVFVNAEKDAEVASSFKVLKDVTVNQFVRNTWFTDSENSRLAFASYFKNVADSSSTVLKASIGTPFSLDGKTIDTVSDARSLSMLFYTMGYEVVADHLVASSLAFSGALFGAMGYANVMYTGALEKIPVANTYGIAVSAVRDVADVEGASAPILLDGPFYDLNELSVMQLTKTNFMKIEKVSAELSEEASDLTAVTYTLSQKARVVANFIGYSDKNMLVDSDSSSATIALDLILGTPFTTNDGKIRTITNADSLAQFFDSLGITVKDGRAVYYSFSTSAVMSAAINGMEAVVAHDILVENGCRSRCLSIEDMENAMAEKAAKKEAKAADSQTTEVVEEQTDDAVEDSDVEEIYFESNMESFRAALGEMDGSSQLISALNGCTYNDNDGNNVTLDSSKEGSIITLMYQLGFEFDENRMLVVDGCSYAIEDLEVEKMIQIIDAFYLKTDVDKNVEIPDANEVPKEEKSATFEFDDLYGLVNAFKDIEDGSITVNEAMQGSSFRGMTINDDGDVISCLSNFFGNDAAKEYTYIQVGDFVNLEAVHNYLNANLEGVAEEE